jgi:hypothetical protein
MGNENLIPTDLTSSHTQNERKNEEQTIKKLGIKWHLLYILIWSFLSLDCINLITYFMWFI